jgi:FkbM family methyltransferase
MIFYIIRFYASLHHYFHSNFRVNLRGLGWLYRRMNKNSVWTIRGKHLFFNHHIADNYGRLINGHFNEPETHIFLDYVFSRGSLNFHFVDIGGNIGEFVMDYGDHDNISFVTVFEPQYQQYISIAETVRLNDFKKVVLENKAVNDLPGITYFNFNKNNSTASGITNDLTMGQKILATSLDFEYKKWISTSLFVLLIDVEGSELNVLKGGSHFIKKFMPLIIFEYNHVTKLHFQISDVKLFLGSEYDIYRLRPDGKLDLNFNKTWNLVALPKSENFRYLESFIMS